MQSNGKEGPAIIDQVLQDLVEGGEELFFDPYASIENLRRIGAYGLRPSVFELAAEEQGSPTGSCLDSLTLV